MHTIGPMMADKVMDKELSEPARGPYSNALDVPIACEALPMAIPAPNVLSIRNHLKRNGPKMAPVIPAMMTKAAVNEGLPPIASDTSIATGVVNDFGIRL